MKSYKIPYYLNILENNNKMGSYIFEPLVTASLELFINNNPNICEYESSIINGFINPYIDYRWCLANMRFVYTYYMLLF